MKKIVLFMVLFVTLSLNVQAGTIYGQVVDSVSGEPIPGAEISIGNQYGAITNSEGEYCIINIPSNTYMIIADAYMYYTSYSDTVSLIDGIEIEYNFTLNPDYVMEQRILIIDTVLRSERQVVFAITDRYFFKTKSHMHNAPIYEPVEMFASVFSYEMPPEVFLKPREVVKISAGFKMSFNNEYWAWIAYSASVERFIQPGPEFLELQNMVRDSLITK